MSTQKPLTVIEENQQETPIFEEIEEQDSNFQKQPLQQQETTTPKNKNRNI